MRLQVFSPVDREVFHRACEWLGEYPEEKLRERLGTHLIANTSLASPLLDTDGLMCAGRRELEWFSVRWPAGQRGAARLVRQGARALRSLETVLFYPGLGELDLVQRAGLHRLARALCDLDWEEVAPRLAHFPESWKDCLRSTCQLLAERAGDPETSRILRDELNFQEERIPS